jgi:hypothetical protein
MGLVLLTLTESWLRYNIAADSMMEFKILSSF